MKPSRVLPVVIVLALAAMWVYALWPRDATPETLIDDGSAEGVPGSFGAEAEVICEPRRAAVMALPPAETATSPQDRAVVLDQANAIVDETIALLRQIPLPPSAEDRTIVREWLDDYVAYAEARRTHADRLRAGEDPQFTVPAVDGTPITERMDFFAKLNGMPSCRVPLDV